jgi:CheY-like chemotaxis protein
VLAYVPHLVNARVPPASTAHPVKFVRRDFLDLRARHALRAVQLAMTVLPVQDVVSHLRRPTSHQPVIVLTAFVVPMDNARATQAGPPHPTALNVQPVLRASSSMGMVTVLFADWAANNAQMAVASVSPASKALLRTLTTAQRVMQCNR